MRLALALCSLLPLLPAQQKLPPNFIVFFVDDLGYGDLGCFGHPTIRTPHLDQMARDGRRMTQFYVAASVCTPSRAGLLTGRLPIRSGMCSGKRRVLFPDSKGGLPAGELTIAEALKPLGYASACIGKWHLGHHERYLPTRHGFDSYFGIPYSNDMDRVRGNPKGRQAFWKPKSEYWNVPLLRGTEVIERPAQQETLTKRYTEEALRFIATRKGKPFFLYLPYTMVHVPLFASEGFLGRSRAGLYGDTVEEIDDSVGQIRAALKAAGIDKNTMLVFTSDNGPWLPYGDHGGSAGLLREGKGSTWEGGMRVPTIICWPGQLHGEGSDCAAMGSTLDLLPTFVSQAGGKLPEDRVYDGVDLSPVLRGQTDSPRQTMLYYRGEEVWALRMGPYKAHFKSRSGYGRQQAQVHETPLLYHLERDPSEKRNIARRHPEVIERMRSYLAAHRKTIKPVPNQLH